MLNLHNNLSHRTATIASATQDSNQWHDCHAGQPQQSRFSPKAARNRRRQGIANIRSGGLLPRKHSPDGAIARIRLNGPASHLSTSEGWKAELA